MDKPIRVQSVVFPERPLGAIVFLVHMTGYGIPKNFNDRRDYADRFFTALCSKR